MAAIGPGRSIPAQAILVKVGSFHTPVKVDIGRTLPEKNHREVNAQIEWTCPDDPDLLAAAIE